MGLGGAFKRAVHKAGGATRIAAYAVPVYAVLTSKGREAVAKAYKPVLGAASSYFGGGAAGNVAGQALDRFAGSYGEVGGMTRSAQADAPGATYASPSGLPSWLIPAGIAAAVAALVYALWRRKK